MPLYHVQLEIRTITDIHNVFVVCVNVTGDVCIWTICGLRCANIRSPVTAEIHKSYIRVLLYTHVYMYIVCALLLHCSVKLMCAGLCGSLEVRNELNVPASFQWHAREGVDTSIFFMLHPNGESSQ